MTHGATGGPATELFVEFDSAQLTIATDVEAIFTFVKNTYAHMLSDAVTTPSGRLEVWRTEGGFAIEGSESVELRGDRCEPLLPYLKEEILRQFMRARPEFLWLHSAAVERDGHAVLQITRMTKGESALELLRNLRNLVDHQAAGVERVARLAREVPAYRLCYGSADESVSALKALA